MAGGFGSASKVGERVELAAVRVLAAWGAPRVPGQLCEPSCLAPGWEEQACDQFLFASSKLAFEILVDGFLWLSLLP